MKTTKNALGVFFPLRPKIAPIIFLWVTVPYVIRRKIAMVMLRVAALQRMIKFVMRWTEKTAVYAQKIVVIMKILCYKTAFLVTLVFRAKSFV